MQETETLQCFKQKGVQYRKLGTCKIVGSNGGVGSRHTSWCDSRNIAEPIYRECCFLCHDQESGGQEARPWTTETKKSSILPKMPFGGHRAGLGSHCSHRHISSSLNRAVWLTPMRCFSTLKKLETGHWQPQILPALHPTKCLLGRWTLPHFYPLSYLAVVAQVILLSKSKPSRGKVSCLFFSL